MSDISSAYKQKLARKRRVMQLNRMMRRRKLEKSRQFAYLGISVVVLAVLFWITPWIISNQVEQDSDNIKLNKEGEISTVESDYFELSKGGLYTFSLKPKANKTGYKDETIEQGVYIELIDEQGQRIYSFKNFYSRQYIYEKYDVEYEIPMKIHIRESGKYKLRIVAPSKPFELFNLKVYKQWAGGLYFKFYRWIFLGGAILLLISGGAIGSLREWRNAIKRRRAVIKNWQTLVAFIAVLIYIGCVVIAILHYGYAGYGSYNHAPTSWFNDQYVYYLGP